MSSSKITNTIFFMRWEILSYISWILSLQWREADLRFPNTLGLFYHVNLQIGDIKVVYNWWVEYLRHGWSLHDLVCMLSLWLHPTFPISPFTQFLVHCCVPLPQDLLQSPYLLHFSKYGHSCSLHFDVIYSLSVGHPSFPTAPPTHILLQYLLPPPQVLVHVL